ncbi:MAG TPA: helix-turn-helix domain-containing protein [Vicinamibacterales bacterium]|jgi:excisionase family DNA binding protein|nr:helix-turn-helix domain-containing protein [Vicinamibacterales bacterium]|tara:strand:- start:782 stop:1039 length:258 start_codon:yes stop_codon:yes gene_type:complete
MPPPAWLTVVEAAQHARCGTKLIYREVNAGRLQAVRVGGRREIRLTAAWVDNWLLATIPAHQPPATIPAQPHDAAAEGGDHGSTP